MTACPVERCTRPTHPGWTVCRACAGDLEQAIAEVPALVEHLEASLSRQVGRSYDSGGRSSVTPLPFDAAASEAGWVLRSTLVGWIRDLEADVTRHPVDNVPAMARWLLRRLGDLLVHPAADEAVAELTSATRAGWQAVDAPPDRVFLGQCPQCRLADVYAPVSATRVACRECHAEHGVEALRDALRAAVDGLVVTGPEFAGLAIAHLGVTVTRDRLEGRVQTWATRGLITAVGHIQRAGSAQPTYRFAELRARIERAGPRG